MPTGAFLHPIFTTIFPRGYASIAARLTVGSGGALLLLSSILIMAMPPAAAEGVYSGGGWSTLHKGPGNRKQVNNVALADDYVSQLVLAGSSVLTAPVLSPDGQQFYVTTGQGVGYSNLHAFTVDGKPLWASTAVDHDASGAQAGVDGCAILSSAIVDVDGDVYLSDCDQLWAFHDDGRLKWVVDQPLPPENAWQPAWASPGKRVVNAFTTALFTRQGHILGITNYGHVRVHDRATGALLNAPLVLPGLQPALSSKPLPDSMLSEGLMDPELRVWAWQLLMGGAMPSANTPAVDLGNGRVFVAVSATTPGKGALLALDVDTIEDGGVAIGLDGDRNHVLRPDAPGPERERGVDWAADLIPNLTNLADRPESAAPARLDTPQEILP